MGLWIGSVKSNMKEMIGDSPFFKEGEILNNLFSRRQVLLTKSSVIITDRKELTKYF